MTTEIPFKCSPEMLRKIAESFIDMCNVEQLKEAYEWALKAKDCKDMDPFMKQYAGMVYKVIVEREDI